MTENLIDWPAVQAQLGVRFPENVRFPEYGHGTREFIIVSWPSGFTEKCVILLAIEHLF